MSTAAKMTALILLFLSDYLLYNQNYNTYLSIVLMIDKRDKTYYNDLFWNTKR